MKFLHTADWQLGMRAAHAGAAASRVREERLAAARRVVEGARAFGAEFILLAGDVFEDNGVDRLLVQKAADILAGFEGPVYIIPGNHDPLTPGSIWNHPVWARGRDEQEGGGGARPAAPRLLTEEKPVQVPGGVLFPCPIRAKHSGRDPTAWIPPRDDSGPDARGIRIGLAHGTVEGVGGDEADHPIPRDAAARAGLDYLALGHWHSTALFASADGATRMAYSGTHETTGFGERDSGNALIVEIAGPGSAPVVTPVRTGRLTWRVIEAELREPGDLARLRAQIEAHGDAETTLLDVRLDGLCAPTEEEELARVEEIVASRFLHARVDASRLRPFPDDADWMSGLPPGPVQEAAARLRMLADPAYKGSRPEEASSEVASQALRDLYLLAAASSAGEVRR
ncbi:MAG: DNA repair exonuclease [Armatimonadetes bacterium]|nr:DNA repair exonuclease [Armatimonadota bacterium]